MQMYCPKVVVLSGTSVGHSVTSNSPFYVVFSMFSGGDKIDVHSIPSIKIPSSAECLPSSQFIEFSCSVLCSANERHRVHIVLLIVCKGERISAQPWRVKNIRTTSVSSEPYSGLSNTVVLSVRLYSCYRSFLSMYTRDER